jgi:hypothetical protein
MKSRKLLIGAVASVVLAGGFVGTARAAPLVPSISGVSLKLVAPSVISSGGAYELSVSATAPFSGVCQFYLYRYTSYYGGWQGLGYYGGTATTDVAQDYWGFAEYEMIPIDCSGNQGAGKYSNGFYPATLDNPFYVPSGSYGYVGSSKCFGGSALNTQNPGQEMIWNTDDDYNLGIVVATGISGGTGTVYVDGVKQGTINFFSKKFACEKLRFKFGTSSASYHQVVIVATNRGKGGGYGMYTDAGVENQA